MKRRAFAFGVLSLATLAGCGGGGGGEAEERPIPGFWSFFRGGTIVLSPSEATVKFDLSWQGRVLGLATKDLQDTNPDPAKRRDDPTRDVFGSDVKEVVFTSAKLGGVETSPARAKWHESGVVTLPNMANSDGQGWFFVILHSGEAIAFAMGPDLPKSRYAVTGTTSVVVGPKGDISYGDFRLSRIEFPNPTTVHMAFESDVLGGVLSEFARPADLLHAQWNCDDTGWLEKAFPRMRMPVQVDASGRAYCDFLRMPNNAQGLFTFHHRDGRVLWINPGSPLWGSLGGMERVVVNARGEEHLRYGGYRLGGITRPNVDTLRIDWGVNLLHSLVLEGTVTLVDVSLADIAYFQFISERLGWDASPARGAPVVLSNGDYRVDITGISATGDQKGFVKAYTNDGRKLALNPNAPRFAGSVTTQLV